MPSTPPSLIDASFPTHVAPQTANVRAQFAIAKSEITQLQTNSPSVVDGRDYGFIEGDTGAAEADPTRWQTMLTAAPAYSKVTLPKGKHLITAGAGGNGVDSASNILIRKPLLIDLGGSRILWQPTVSNDTLLTVSATGMAAPNDNITEESHIFGFGVKNGRIIGNRVTRANALRFMRVDYAYLDDVFFYGIKGCSVNVQRTRQSVFKGLRTQFCGYLDPVDMQNSVSDVLLASDLLTGDNTNFCHFENCMLIYSLGPLLTLDDTHTISFGNLMLHMLQEGNTNNEEVLFINAFGGSAGYSAPGVANNEYAGLHVNVGTEADCDGLPWKPAMRKCRPLRVSNSTDINITRLSINGGFMDSLIALDQSSSLSLGPSVIGGAQSATTYHTSQTFTVNATTNLMTMDTATPYLLTGDAVRLTTATTLPAVTPTSASLILHPYGSTNLYNNTYFVRLTNGPTNTTYTLHRTWHQAMFNTSILDFTNTGTGTHTLTSAHGECIEVNNGSVVSLDGSTRLDNDRWHVNDDQTSRVTGNYRSGNSFGDVTAGTLDIGRGFGGMVVLTALKGADMTSTADQQFQRIYAGSTAYWTALVAVVVSGVATGAVGGLYQAASKTTPFTFMPATFTWDKLTAANVTLEFSRFNGFGSPPVVASTQTPNRSATVACSALRGIITTDSTSLAAGADATFTVTNTLVNTGDMVHVTLASGSTANTSVFNAINIVDATSFQIRAHNLSGSTADTAAAVLNFRVDKQGPLLTGASSFFVPHYLSLTTGSSTPCIVDFYEIGIPANHP